jgi:hypothetical protein
MRRLFHIYIDVEVLLFKINIILCFMILYLELMIESIQKKNIKWFIKTCKVIRKIEK